MQNKELEMKAQGHDISEASEAMTQAAEETKKEAVSGYKKIENGVVTGYKKIENGVVTGYKKIEAGAVEGFQKVTDKCVQVLFAKEGETVEEAKARLQGKNKA